MKYIAEKEAAQFRTEQGYSSTDPIRFKSLLLKLNIITLFKPLSSHFSGMAVRAMGQRFMLINSNHSVARQHFSICHELYHLCVQPDFETHHSLAGQFNTKEKTEYAADLFAANLLMPKAGLLNLIPNSELGNDTISLGTVLKLEHYYSCSRKALLIRLKQIDLISERKLQEFSKNIMRSASEYGYSTDLYKPNNTQLVLGDYGTLAKQLFDKEKISEGHYISLMHDIGYDVLNDENRDDED